MTDEIIQHQKFRKKYGSKTFSATCIQTGTMKVNDLLIRSTDEKEYFCFAGKKYPYILVDDPNDPIRMKSECDKSFVVFSIGRGEGIRTLGCF